MWKSVLFFNVARFNIPAGVVVTPGAVPQPVEWVRRQEDTSASAGPEV